MYIYTHIYYIIIWYSDIFMYYQVNLIRYFLRAVFYFVNCIAFDCQAYTIYLTLFVLWRRAVPVKCWILIYLACLNHVGYDTGMLV